MIPHQAGFDSSLNLVRDFSRFLASVVCFFLKKTIELSYWRGKISFRTSPPIEEDLLFTFSINTFEEVFRSIWKLACGTKTYRDFVVARPLRDMKSSFRSLFFFAVKLVSEVNLWQVKSSNICSRSILKRSQDMDKNAISTRWISIAKVSQTLYYAFLKYVSDM